MKPPPSQPLARRRLLLFGKAGLLPSGGGRAGRGWTRGRSGRAPPGGRPPPLLSSLPGCFSPLALKMAAAPVDVEGGVLQPPRRPAELASPPFSPQKGRFCFPSLAGARRISLPGCLGHRLSGVTRQEKAEEEGRGGGATSAFPLPRGKHGGLPATGADLWPPLAGGYDDCPPPPPFHAMGKCTILSFNTCPFEAGGVPLPFPFPLPFNIIGYFVQRESRCCCHLTDLEVCKVS